MAKTKVLVVDDDDAIRFGVHAYLEAKGYDVLEASDCRGAEDAFTTERPDIAILDYRLTDGDALSILPRLKEIDAAAPVLILTGHGSIDLAVRAIQEGADHFLTKPVDLAALAAIVARLVEGRRRRRRQLASSALEDRKRPDPFVGISPAIRQLEAQARKIAASDSPVLLTGETGTGKSVLAAWLHDNSSRSDEPFVDLSCAGLAPQLLETELFGHEKGAFTSAATKKLGLLEVAHRGTVFLDEIGDVDPQVQPKLLKVVEEKRFRRVGDVRDRQVDIRLIAATHQDLRELIQQKKFRSDLYFRISTIPVRIPSLRERIDDVVPLARRILQIFALDFRRAEGVTLSPEAEEALARYSWPGNIRELRNVLERALLMSDKKTLGRAEICFDTVPDEASRRIPTDLTLAELERLHITAVLAEEKGRVVKAAERLGISRSALYEKIKRHKIDPESF